MSDMPAKPPGKNPTNTTNSNEVMRAADILFQDLIKEANHILKAGTPANKIALIRSVIPVLMKELQAQTSEDENRELRDNMTELFANVRDTLDVDPKQIPDV
jgi:hypothetical protein